MAEKSSLNQLFEEKIQQAQLLLSSLESKSRRQSWLRLAAFLTLLIGFIYFANARQMAPMAFCLLLMAILLPVLVYFHQKTKEKIRQQQVLIKINQEEIWRLSLELSQLNGGSKFKNPKHPYSDDLDVFGAHSLFALLNRCVTPGGEDFLANWLKQGSPKSIVLARQSAIRELSPQLDFRQNLQLWMHEESLKQGTDLMDKWSAWLKETAKIADKISWRWYFPWLPIATIASIALYFSLGISWPVLILLLVQIWLLKPLFQHLKDSIEWLLPIGKMLKNYRHISNAIEHHALEAPLLVEIQDELKNDSEKASVALAKLEKLSQHLSNRQNYFYQLANAFLLLDIWLLVRIAAWQDRYGAKLKHWTDQIHHLEALSSLAGFSFAHPDYCFPTLTEQGMSCKIEYMGHPLIPAKQRVCNGLDWHGQGQLIILTGSNMSGKSTFQRTLGVNWLLAMAGAPVCASSADFSEVQLFTSMRTQDNLAESVSSFYAELQRIRSLLDLVENPGQKPILYLLDEILKGTNSADRHTGGKSLALQLMDSQSSGIISTHDLDLGKSLSDHPAVRNLHFSSELVDGKLHFDYLLKQGICKSFNASDLMKSMGIKIQTEPS